jgi:hypothetical protein
VPNSCTRTSAAAERARSCWVHGHHRLSGRFPRAVPGLAELKGAPSFTITAATVIRLTPRMPRPTHTFAQLVDDLRVTARRGRRGGGGTAPCDLLRDIRMGGMIGLPFFFGPGLGRIPNGCASLVRDETTAARAPDHMPRAAASAGRHRRDRSAATACKRCATLLRARRR